MISKPWQRVHIKLLQSLPVRTHYKPEKERKWGKVGEKFRGGGKALREALEREKFSNNN